MNLKAPYSLTHLLPYSESTVLKDRKQKLSEMRLIQNIILTSIVALKQFHQGKLTHFDAQVGENLCQIRACKTIYLAQQWLGNPWGKARMLEFIQELKLYYQRVKHFIGEREALMEQTKHYEAALDKTETIENFLTGNELDLRFEEDMLYLISCFFLTYFSQRVDNIPLSIDFKQIALKFSVSKHRAERLAHRYQLIVSKLGCDFIVKIAKNLPQERKYSKVLAPLYQLADVDRTVLPCHLVSEIILSHCIQEEIPVLILFNRIGLEQKEIVYFVMEGEDFVPVTGDKPCLVVLGDNLSSRETSYDYMHYLNNLKLTELILANTATHPQYAGSRLNQYSDNPFLSLLTKKNEAAEYFSDRLEMLKTLASEVGCSKEFKLEFFLRHVYASNLAYEINRLHLMGDTVISSGLTLLTSKEILRINGWKKRKNALLMS